MKHRKKHSTARTRKGKRKAFLLLIVLGVVIMCIYFLALQESSDTELVEDTTELNQTGNE